jgi:large subunit ribosomal protein L32e
MADTQEKKVEKKAVKETPEPKPAGHDHKAVEPAPKAPEHGHGSSSKAPEHVHKAVEPAPKAPEHHGEHARKAPAAKTLADEIEKELESSKPGPVKKIEAKPSAKAEARPAEKKSEKPAEEASGEPKEPAGEPSPAGEPEAEIVEDAAEKKETGKGKKKKGRKERRPHIKPQLSAGVVKAMAQRRELKDKTPNFIRQDAYNYGRLGKNWRKPQGTHSKLRHHISYRINVVSIGYGGPNASKGLHPSGFREVLVHNPLELDKVDPKTEAARIAHGVGFRKRTMIEQRAQRKGIRVLNELKE